MPGIAEVLHVLFPLKATYKMFFLIYLLVYGLGCGYDLIKLL